MKKDSRFTRVLAYCGIVFTLGMALWYLYKACSVLWQ